MEMHAVYARLATGSRYGWLRLLCEGWHFSDATVPEPMLGPHGRFAVLMVRNVNTRLAQPYPLDVQPV